MQTLATSELLRVWEQGQAEPPYQRALRLLAAACPEASPEELSQLSVGRRDALLLTLRERTFGPSLTCVAACPACGQRVEFSVQAVDVRAAPPESNADDLRLTVDDYQVDFRLPCTADLAEANRWPDRAGSRAVVIRRCILKVRRRDDEILPDQVPAHVIEAVVASMEKNDPQADIRFSLHCPACDHGWTVLFDIVSYFWTEIQAWALRILQEVHLIASAYGWAEADILAMSPLRRHLYLQMVGA
jgi:hypothetical protein